MHESMVRRAAEELEQEERMARLHSYTRPLNLSALLDEDREPTF